MSENNQNDQFFPELPDFIIFGFWFALELLSRTTAFIAPHVAHLTIVIFVFCFFSIGFLVCLRPHLLRPPKGGFVPMRYRAYSVKTKPKLHNVSDIYHTAFLLKQVLPTDLVPVVLDHAEMWLSSPLASTTRASHITPEDSGRICLTAELPAGLPQGSIRTLSFTTHSKELVAWAPHTHTNRQSFPNDRSRIELSVFPDDTVSKPDNDRLLFPGKRVLRNFHMCCYCNDFFVYDKRWHFRSEDKEIVRIMRSLAGGQKLALIMCADLFPSPCAVQFASIECQISVVRKL
jgi:hypothetical protein